jgi:hypothetical protein
MNKIYSDLTMIRPVIKGDADSLYKIIDKNREALSNLDNRGEIDEKLIEEAFMWR